MSIIEQVVEFNQAILGIAQRPVGPLSTNEHELSIKCVYEEIVEYEDAAMCGDLAGSVDAIVDLMYFSIGILYKHGLSAEMINQACSAVHEANMAKRKGVNAKRDTGAADATKPVDWVPPEVELKRILGVY